MEVQLNVNINKQPDYTTCGPTSLHAIYSYYGDSILLDEVIKDINQFEEGGGTLAAVLGRHALERGYSATIISYNINIFDPTWFYETENDICSFLERSAREKTSGKKHLFAIDQYIKFLKLGGKLRFADISNGLFRNIINKGVPILTGLSSTWLYREEREVSSTNQANAITGDPVGHFVVIEGYNDKNEFSICDPYNKNPITSTNHYIINGTRLINAILLGISSYDGNLLLIEKKKYEP